MIPGRDPDRDRTGECMGVGVGVGVGVCVVGACTAVPAAVPGCRARRGA
jgi:hypothetical protein